MKIKSYYARTIAEAIAQARAELGPDAVIVASRKNDGPSASLGAYEVVCGLIDDKPQPDAPLAIEKPNPAVPAQGTPEQKRRGLFGGISAAGACWVALRLAEQVQGAPRVVGVCDRGDRYLSTGVFPA